MKFKNKLKITGAILITALTITTANASCNDCFVTKWKTDNRGVSDNNSITIPTYGDGAESYQTYYYYDVDWNNDGIFDDLGVVRDITHTYDEPGIYTVAIRGLFPRIYFFNKGDVGSQYTYGEGDAQKLLSVVHWGNNEWNSMSNAFYGASNLIVQAKDIPDLSNVTDLSGMFWGAKSFNQDISGWNTDIVTNMAGMFTYAESFNQDISGWNTENVKNMVYMFHGAKSFNQDISGWITGLVTSMLGMFDGAESFNQDIGNWNTGSVHTMTSLFAGAISFNQDISDWDISSVLNFEHMFDGARLSTPNYDKLLNSWADKTKYGDSIWETPSDSTLFSGGNSMYSSASENARASLMINDNWVISDGGLTVNKIETGTVNIGNEWTTVSIPATFVDPVVFVGTPSYNGADPIVVRLQNVTQTSFDIKLQEWDYLDGYHYSQESVAYMVLEKGIYKLSDGSKVQVGTLNMDGLPAYSTVINDVPAEFELLTVQSYNGNQAVIARKILEESFQFSVSYFSLFEQDTYNDPNDDHYGHVTETVGYLRMITDSGNWNSSDSLVSHQVKTIAYLDHNWQYLTSDVSIKIDEEASNGENLHYNEESGSALILNDELIFIGLPTFNGEDPFTVRLDK